MARAGRCPVFHSPCPCYRLHEHEASRFARCNPRPAVPLYRSFCAVQGRGLMSTTAQLYISAASPDMLSATCAWRDSLAATVQEG